LAAQQPGWTLFPIPQGPQTWIADLNLYRNCAFTNTVRRFTPKCRRGKSARVARYPSFPLRRLFRRTAFRMGYTTGGSLLSPGRLWSPVVLLGVMMAVYQVFQVTFKLQLVHVLLRGKPRPIVPVGTQVNCVPIYKT
jgi:hypothetical protein